MFSKSITKFLIFRTKANIPGIFIHLIQERSLGYLPRGIRRTETVQIYPKMSSYTRFSSTYHHWLRLFLKKTFQFIWRKCFIGMKLSLSRRREMGFLRIVQFEASFMNISDFLLKGEGMFYWKSDVIFSKYNHQII